MEYALFTSLPDRRIKNALFTFLLSDVWHYINLYNYHLILTRVLVRWSMPFLHLFLTGGLRMLFISLLSDVWHYINSYNYHLILTRVLVRWSMPYLHLFLTGGLICYLHFYCQMCDIISIPIIIISSWQED